MPDQPFFHVTLRQIRFNELQIFIDWCIEHIKHPVRYSLLGKTYSANDYIKGLMEMSSYLYGPTPVSISARYLYLSDVQEATICRLTWG
jgi:hypothetical protein